MYGRIPADVVWIEHRHIGIGIVIASWLCVGSAYTSNDGSVHVGGAIIVWCFGMCYVHRWREHVLKLLFTFVNVFSVSVWQHTSECHFTSGEFLACPMAVEPLEVAW